MCNKNKKCSFFVINNTNQNECWLRSNPEKEVINKDRTYFKQLNTQLPDLYTSFDNNDSRDFNINSNKLNRGNCKLVCDSNKQCAGYVLAKDNQGNIINDNCWLKSAGFENKLNYASDRIIYKKI